MVYIENMEMTKFSSCNIVLLRSKAQLDRGRHYKYILIRLDIDTIPIKLHSRAHVKVSIG